MSDIENKLIETAKLIQFQGGLPDVSYFREEDGIMIGFNAKGFVVITMPKEDYLAIQNGRF